MYGQTKSLEHDPIQKIADKYVEENNPYGPFKPLRNTYSMLRSIALLIHPRYLKKCWIHLCFLRILRELLFKLCFEPTYLFIRLLEVRRGGQFCYIRRTNSVQLAEEAVFKARTDRIHAN